MQSLFKKIREKISYLFNKLKVVINDVFLPCKSTFEGIGAVWLEVLQKKESRLRVPDLRTIPVVSGGESPDGLIEVKADDFRGISITNADLSKIKYAVSVLKKECPSFVDIVLEDKVYTVLFNKYPRISKDGNIKIRIEVVIAKDNKAAFVSQFEESDEWEAVIYQTLIKNSLQWAATQAISNKLEFRHQ